MSGKSTKTMNVEECTKDRRIEIFFVEGVNGTGKDYLMEQWIEDFPKLTVYQAPRRNCTVVQDYIGPMQITFNTILDSARLCKTPILIYRSPITNLVYNDFYARLYDREEQQELTRTLINEFRKIGNVTFIYLTKPHHTNEYTTEELCKLDWLYRAAFAKLQIPFIEYKDYDDMMAPLDKMAESLPDFSLLIDVDDTLKKYAQSVRKTRSGNIYLPVVNYFIPEESAFMESFFISGRVHSDLSALQNPLPMKSSFNFKYALIRRLIAAKKRFILYDDYYELLATIEDRYFRASLTAQDGVGRLSYGLDNPVI